MSESNDAWARYWQSESPQGEVFVDPDGDKHPALAEFWTTRFADLPTGARVVDLAAGAGSVLTSIPENRQLHVYACDLSAVAVERLQTRFPAVEASVADAADTPFDDDSMDWVVSQFGIEYAGQRAFPEVRRLLAPGGRFVALCHYRDGQIDQAHQRQLGAARGIVDAGFIDKAIALTIAAFGRDKARFDTAADQFIPAERGLAAQVTAQKSGVHAHLYLGFRQLYQQRRQYDAKDITGWLTAMREEVTNAIERLDVITSVALDRNDIDEIGRDFTASGLVWNEPQPFMGSNADLPVAWTLEAIRPAAD